MAMRLDALVEIVGDAAARWISRSVCHRDIRHADAFGADDVAGIRMVIDAFANRHSVPHRNFMWTLRSAGLLSFLTEYDADENALDSAPNCSVGRAGPRLAARACGRADCND